MVITVEQAKAKKAEEHDPGIQVLERLIDHILEEQVEHEKIYITQSQLDREIETALTMLMESYRQAGWTVEHDRKQGIRIQPISQPSHIPWSIPMNTETITKYIVGYMRRIREPYQSIPIIPLGEEGVFEFCPGHAEKGRVGPNRLYRGRFLDVLTEVVQRYDYRAWQSPPDRYEESLHGHLKRYTLPSIHEIERNEEVEEAIKKLLRQESI